MSAFHNSVRGSLLGLAVGDAMGLPCEGLSRTRQRRMFPDLQEYRLLFGHGLCSDDTEHACLTAQALVSSGGDPELFTRSLAWRLRVWLLGLPAGVGMATARAILKLWLGFPVHRSGVFSAGNGPAMRAPIIGVFCGGDTDMLRAFIHRSTILSHTDPKAEFGALAVALAAHLSGTLSGPITPEAFADQLQALLPDTDAIELRELISDAVSSVRNGESAEVFAERLGLAKGVSGYIYHTVPVVIQVWLRHQQDYPGGILEIIRLGGDTDTTAAILGGIIGARTGTDGIPKAWLTHLWEWPRSIFWMERLADALTKTMRKQNTPPIPTVFFPWILVRNLLFLGVVLTHGFRRLMPPY